MKILVIRAGALGDDFAARLHAAGHQVSVLDLGSRPEAASRKGPLPEEHSAGQTTFSNIPIIEKLTPDADYDWAFVVTRRDQVAGLLPALAASRRIPNVLFLMNNASGAGEMVNLLGRTRVVLGSPGIRSGWGGAFNRLRILRTALGELDGRITPRLQHIAEILTQAGFSPVLTQDIDALLKTRAAIFVPIANALYSARGDNYRLARTRDSLVLLVRALHEGFQVLQALGVPVTPAYLRLIEWLPEPVMVWLLMGLMSTSWARAVIAAPAVENQEELHYLSQALHRLARSTWVRTPVLNELTRYVEPGKQPLPAGSARLPLRWGTLWIWASALVSLFLLRRRSKDPGRSGFLKV